MEPSPLENQFLSLIPEDAQARLFKYMDMVILSRDDIVYASGTDLAYVYFPVNAIISLIYDLADGGSTEIAMIGNEGLLGIAVFMGGDSAPSRAVVIKTGCAFRISAKRIKDEFNRHEEVLVLLLRYTQSLISQVAQTAVCNRRHTIEQQLCRFLLLFLDRSTGNKILLTQSLIAFLLGVRREGVTVSANKLQSLGAIKCFRGKILVVNRTEIEAHCCECYQSVRLAAR
ncbi:hypothetical protein TDB9533_00762 [Thalassocella blandensis]|nr:hypothetical protein TDB9533_00762 [Thalassocella blandensis]